MFVEEEAALQVWGPRHSLLSGLKFWTQTDSELLGNGRGKGSPRHRVATFPGTFVPSPLWALVFSSAKGTATSAPGRMKCPRRCKKA